MSLYIVTADTILKFERGAQLIVAIHSRYRCFRMYFLSECFINKPTPFL